MERTVEVADLQSKLLDEMGKTGEKSNVIIELQNELNDASNKILRLSQQNTKQILGDGAPSLALHVFHPEHIWPNCKGHHRSSSQRITFHGRLYSCMKGPRKSPITLLPEGQAQKHPCPQNF